MHIVIIESYDKVVRRLQDAEHSTAAVEVQLEQRRSTGEQNVKIVSTKA